MTEPLKNRRQHVRIYRNFILSYHLKGKGNIKFEMSQVNNISKGGVNFISTTPFDAGSVLVIGLKTPFLSGKVELEGTVLDSKEKIQGILYEVRVQFNDVSPQSAEILAKIEQYSAQGNK